MASGLLEVYKKINLIPYHLNAISVEPNILLQTADGDFVHWVDLNLALSLVTFIIARIAVFLNSKVCEVNFFFGRNQV